MEKYCFDYTEAGSLLCKQNGSAVGRSLAAKN